MLIFSRTLKKNKKEEEAVLREAGYYNIVMHH